MLMKLDRNWIYQAITENRLDPAECNLSETDTSLTIIHDSGSTFGIVVNVGPKPSYTARAAVVDGSKRTYTTELDIQYLLGPIGEWAYEVYMTSRTPDYWEEIRRSRESIAIIRREDFDNTPFTSEEQRQIEAQFHEVRNQLVRLSLSVERVSEIEEKLDELVEASHHLGRKDWLIILITTISPLAIGDVLTPGVARHIFTMIINGLIHLFGGGPPQLLS